MQVQDVAESVSEKAERSTTGLVDEVGCQDSGGDIWVNALENLVSLRKFPYPLGPLGLQKQPLHSVQSQHPPLGLGRCRDFSALQGTHRVAHVCTHACSHTHTHPSPL